MIFLFFVFFCLIFFIFFFCFSEESAAISALEHSVLSALISAKIPDFVDEISVKFGRLILGRRGLFVLKLVPLFDSENELRWVVTEVKKKEKTERDLIRKCQRKRRDLSKKEEIHF